MTPLDKIQDLFEYVSSAISKEPAGIIEGLADQLKYVSKRSEKTLHLIAIDYSVEEPPSVMNSTEEIEVFNHRIVCEYMYWKYATKEIAKFPRTSIIAAIIGQNFPTYKARKHMSAFCHEIPLILLSGRIKDINSFKISVPIAWEIIPMGGESYSTFQLQAAISQHLTEKRVETLYYKSFMLLLDDLLNLWKRKREAFAEEIKSHRDKLQLQIHQIKTRNLQEVKDDFANLVLDLKKEVFLLDKEVQKIWERDIEFSTVSLWAKLRDRIIAIEELEELKKRGGISFQLYEYDKLAVINSLGHTLSLKCSHDVKDINVLMEHFNDEFMTLFDKHKITAMKARTISSHLDVYKDIISRSCMFRRSFEGEMKTKGFMQYFYAVRQYQMLIFMVLGGGSLGLAKMGNNKDWLFPIGFFFIGLAIVQVVYKTIKDNDEHKEKELRKAQEWIKMEVKGMLQLFWREWKATRSEILSDQFEELRSFYERQLQKHLGHASMKVEEQETRLRAKNKKNETLSLQLKTASPLGYQFEGKYKGTNDMLTSLFKTSQ